MSVTDSFRDLFGISPSRSSTRGGDPDPEALTPVFTPVFTPDPGALTPVFTVGSGSSITAADAGPPKQSPEQSPKPTPVTSNPTAAVAGRLSISRASRYATMADETSSNDQAVAEEAPLASDLVGEMDSADGATQPGGAEAEGEGEEEEGAPLPPASLLHRVFSSMFSMASGRHSQGGEQGGAGDAAGRCGSAGSTPRLRVKKWATVAPPPPPPGRAPRRPIDPKSRSKFYHVFGGLS